MGKNEGKGRLGFSPCCRGERSRKKRGRKSKERERGGWRITMEAKGPRENSVLDGRGEEGPRERVNGTNVRGKRGKG